jgi:uncharacterized protein involved in response to NO
LTRPSYGKQPFRSFFAVAALDAIFGAAIWTPALSWAQPWLTGPSAGDWHRQVLLYGTFPAMLAGFLLTALPRWTGQAGPRKAVSKLLLALWVAARGSYVLGPHGSGPAIAAVFLFALTLTTAGYVISSRDRRNYKIVLLLFGFSASAAMTAASYQVGLTSRLSLAAMTGLLMVVGGRVIPALTAAYLCNSGAQPVSAPVAVVEKASAAAATLALIFWIAMPDGQVTAVACAVGALLQLARATQWRGWQIRLPAAVAALHVGYCWIGLGFALLALHILVPSHVSTAAPVHAWTVGAFGTMSLAIMGSMIRKHSGLAFARSIRATAAYAAMTCAAVVRVGGELLPSNTSMWLGWSGGLWLVAFLLFIAAFHQPLLVCGCQPDR